MTMELRNKRVLVVGLGKTGEALACFLAGRGAAVVISEKKPSHELGEKISFWKERGVKVEAGKHKLESFLRADLIIPSPGAASIPELAAARKVGVPVLSEVELAFRFLKGKIVGITGTNGKSTTTTLVHKILKEAGLKAFLSGNIGTPLISFVERSRDDRIYVTEISSFQLEHIETFRVPLAAFLNISRNHLDWHGSFENYFSAKKRLVLGQEEGDIVILNRDDSLVWPLSKEVKSRVFAFSRKKEVSPGCFVRDGWVILKDGPERKIIKVADIRLPGLHNRDNVMAAALVGHLCGVSPGSMRKSIRSFKGLEHRLEKVLTLRGVEFINDSKATTVEAAAVALQSIDRKVILILGGRDKGADFSLLRKPVREKVGKIILIGEAREKIARALDGVRPMETAASMKEAVSLGLAAASRGEAVLLAPACTSFDMFNNFEERGRAFKREARLLARKLMRKAA